MILLLFYRHFFCSQGQVMYPPNSGYAMTQYPGGVPVTVPMQAGGGMVPIQTVTPGPQVGQPHLAIIPVSGTAGNQKLLLFGHFSFNRNNTQTAVTNMTK